MVTVSLSSFFRRLNVMPRTLTGSGSVTSPGQWMAVTDSLHAPAAFASEQCARYPLNCLHCRPVCPQTCWWREYFLSVPRTEPPPSAPYPTENASRKLLPDSFSCFVVNLYTTRFVVEDSYVLPRSCISVFYFIGKNIPKEHQLDVCITKTVLLWGPN